jgi:hypothetical protein
MIKVDSNGNIGTPPLPEGGVPLLEEEEFDLPESAAPDEIEDETGIDLTDASDLDADNVPADEESERVVHAPD